MIVFVRSAVAVTDIARRRRVVLRINVTSSDLAQRGVTMIVVVVPVVVLPDLLSVSVVGRVGVLVE